MGVRGLGVIGLGLIGSELRGRWTGVLGSSPSGVRGGVSSSRPSPVMAPRPSPTVSTWPVNISAASRCPRIGVVGRWGVEPVLTNDEEPEVGAVVGGLLVKLEKVEETTAGVVVVVVTDAGLSDDDGESMGDAGLKINAAATCSSSFCRIRSRRFSARSSFRTQSSMAASKSARARA